MFPSLRVAMAWVHTWFGLVLGFVLMAAFFFGSLAVFDREIDRWAMPAARFEAPGIPSFDQVLRPVFESMQPSAADIAALEGPVPDRFDLVNYWQAAWSPRDAGLALYIGYELPGRPQDGAVIYAGGVIDARTGEAMPAGFPIGSGFFYPLHFNLTLEWQALGTWIVGLSALVMLAALVSGVIMHRKLFRELFTFRPGKGQRSTLDLHNFTGVIALPFHFFLALTGLAIFATTYFPVTHTQLAPLHEAHEAIEHRDSAVRDFRSGVPAPVASVDAIVADAQRRWAARGLSTQLSNLIVLHVGDANGYVYVERLSESEVAPFGNAMRFRLSDGEFLNEDPPRSAAAGVMGYLSGLHLMPFQHWMLRWLYFFAGLVGCVCIATGFLFFVEKRKRQHAKQGSPGARIVEALSVTTVTGMVIATLAVMAGNRLIPADWPAHWPAPIAVQVWLFWLTWLLTLCHAFWRCAPVARAKTHRAWFEQCAAIAVLAVLAVLLNGLTTGDHLLHTLRQGNWAIAGVDLVLLMAGACGAFAAIFFRAAPATPLRRPRHDVRTRKRMTC